jgi:TM2 domain-containing membrane protein YozV
VIQIPFCPSCGSNVETGKRFCENCGAPLAALPATATPPAATPQYTPPPTPAFAPQQVTAQQKSAGLAAIASFLCPGLGQTYNGSFGKGLLILIGTLIGSLIFFKIPGIIIWLYGVYDAYSTAKKMNEGQLPFVPHSTMHMIGFIVIVIVIFIIYFLIIMAAMVAMMGAYTPYEVPTPY